MATLPTTQRQRRRRNRVYGKPWNSLERRLGRDELCAALKDLHVEKGLTVTETAKRLGVTYGVASRYMQEFGIPARRTKALKDLTGLRFGRLCVEGRAGPPRGKREKVKWKCRCDCGNTAVVIGDALKRGNTTSCGCYRLETHSGPQHYLWKEDGDTKLNSHGYVVVRMRNHPNANKRGWALEHHVVMAQHLGRPILEGETVHHKNGNRADNRLENLELWSHSHPYGQRVEDKIAWCVDFLSQYAPHRLVQPTLSVGAVGKSRKPRH